MSTKSKELEDDSIGGRQTRSLRNANPTEWRTVDMIAALDIGTTKACCLIASDAEGDELQVVGIGHHASRGLRAGNLVDLDGAEASVRAAVDSAERMAGGMVRRVVVNLSAGQPNSQLIAYDVSVAGHEIGDADVRRILDPGGFMHMVPEDHEVIHVVPVGYSIDGCRGVRDPRGMFGQRLGVNLHLISANTSAVRNLATCISRCHLEIVDRVVSPHAAALGCLVEDEKTLGVTLIDLGGGTTSIAVFFDSELLFTEVLPIGGLHVSRDVARGLQTPLGQAERIKTLYGACVATPADDRRPIDVPPMMDEGGGDYSQVPKSMLVGIIRPRMEEIFEMVRARLEDEGLHKIAGRRVVLTGGGAQLSGAAELAGKILDKQVRVGRPLKLKGLPEAAAGPSFATCAGLLRHAAQMPADSLKPTYKPEASVGKFGRIGQWFRENF
jgi:cell division protein FtsA